MQTRPRVSQRVLILTVWLRRVSAAAAAAVSDCQCKCFQTLGDTRTYVKLSGYPNFPICNKKFCGCLNCFKLVGFERLVKKRRDECLSPTELPKVSGNFVDCRYHGRQTPSSLNSVAIPPILLILVVHTLCLSVLQLPPLPQPWQEPTI